MSISTIDYYVKKHQINIISRYSKHRKEKIIMSKEEQIEQAIEQHAKESYAETLLDTDKHCLEDVHTDLETALNNFINIDQPVYEEVIVAVKDGNYTEAAQIIQNDSYERRLFVDTLDIDELMYGELYRSDASDFVNEDDFIDDEDVSKENSSNLYDANLNIGKINVLSDRDVKFLVDGLNARKTFYEHLNSQQSSVNPSIDNSEQYWKKFDKLFNHLQDIDDRTPGCGDFIEELLPKNDVEAYERIKVVLNNMENLEEILTNANDYIIPVFDDNNDERSLTHLSLPLLQELKTKVSINNVYLRGLCTRYSRDLKQDVQR